MTDYEWVDSATRLSELVTAWRDCDFIVLDTEFIRRRTYYAELGLLQVAADDGLYLIDPLSIDDLGDRLRPILTDPSVEIVFHSGEEDLEILGQLLGEPVKCGVDTQLGWGFVSGESSVGYARLMTEQLGVDVPKDQTQSNWVARPLTEKQCQYAINDVLYLQRFYPGLREQLVAKSRLEWVKEDVDRIARKVLDRDDLTYYLNIRQAWKLKGNRLWLLQQLAWQREQKCQTLNVNRKALISDNDLVLLAQQRPRDVAAISTLTEIKPSVLRRESDWILRLIAESHTVDSSQYPPPVQGPMPRELAADWQSIRSRMRQIAEAEGIPAEYLARKKDLEAYIQAARAGQWDAIPDAWSGWRWSLFGESLQKALQDRISGKKRLAVEKADHEDD